MLMNILMFTNTFTPHVGGVARSVQGLAAALRELGHRVLVVAPVFQGTPDIEADVIRVPALKHFWGSDFSVPMPVGHRLSAAVRTFKPDIVHAHHPFLLGDTALRIAAAHDIPAVFTYHTRYEHYTHYVQTDSSRFKRMALDLAIGYCNLCDAVIAPSESVANFLRQHGLEVPVEVVPSGVRVESFANGNGVAARARMDIPQDAFVVGHVGRLAPEKNLAFLADSVARFLLTDDRAHCLIAGDGPLKQSIVEIFEAQGLGSRYHWTGVLDNKALADVYQAMDVFAFSSHSETQGLVLVEAMAAAVPVVALDASGVREVVRDKTNGRLLVREDAEDYAAALAWVAKLGAGDALRMQQVARETAAEFSLTKTTARMLDFYHTVLANQPSTKDIDSSFWIAALRSVAVEWKILRNAAQAVGDAVLSLPTQEEH